MAKKFGVRRLRTVGAEAGTGRHRRFRLPTLRFEIQHRLTCPMDRAGQIFLIIHDTHPTHTVRREARGHISVVIFATKTTSLYNSEHTTLKLWPRLPLDTSLAGRVPQGEKVARTWYPRKHGL
jgi:hypothetical protein